MPRHANASGYYHTRLDSSKRFKGCLKALFPWKFENKPGEEGEGEKPSTKSSSSGYQC